MEIIPVSEVLAIEGLQAPTIKALVPSVDNYTALLMQPLGYIEASAAGVRNRDRALAQRQFSGFLAKASQTNADLVVTPEYSMPWVVLIDAIKSGLTPAAGKLWALGCESIKYAELDALKDELRTLAAVVFEPLQAEPERFVDPLAYLFLAPLAVGGGPPRLVLLVQFKTHPMGDPDHFEINALQRGSRIYEFGSVGQSIRLVSLICSDAFDFLDAEALRVYDRALVIHIQLTPKPRHQQYRLYRDRLLRFDGDATELICLNWAGDVREWCPDQEKLWRNIAGSAWYLKPNTKFDDRDEALAANHRRGLYYTWLYTLRVHALFFNYKPAVYLLNATKVVHVGVAAALSRRRGPQLIRGFNWDREAAAWIEADSADDGFSTVADESHNAKHEIKRLSNENPFAAERLLALCAGKIGHDENWHAVCVLDSCIIDASEVIRRLTFCQDTDPAASEFRVARLKRCGQLWEILRDHKNLPPALADLADGFRLEWLLAFPHQNAISNQGRRATLIYMGHDFATQQIEAVATRVAEFLQRGYSDPRDSLAARQRIAVWFRDARGQVVSLPMDRYIRIDKTGDRGEFDIGREQ